MPEFKKRTRRSSRTISIALPIEVKERFDKLKGKDHRPGFLTKLMDNYEGGPNPKSLNNKYPLLVKLSIKKDNVSTYVTPKKYMVRGCNIFCGSIQDFRINQRDLFKPLKSLIIDCYHRICVIREEDEYGNLTGRFIIHEEYRIDYDYKSIHKPEFHILRIRTFKNKKDLLDHMKSYRNKINLDDLDCCISDEIEDDKELEAYMG